MAVDEERLRQPQEIQGGKKGEQKDKWDSSGARGSAELGKVAYASAKQSLWLENRKVGS